MHTVPPVFVKNNQGELNEAPICGTRITEECSKVNLKGREGRGFVNVAFWLCMFIYYSAGGRLCGLSCSAQICV